MSTLGDPGSARRVTRGGSRAPSDEGTSHPGESSISRRTRTRASAPQLNDRQIKAPKITNKPSRAYGAQGKSAIALGMSTQNASQQNQASALIASAVQRAEAPKALQERKAPELPAVPEDELEEEDSTYGTGPRNPRRPSVGDISITEHPSRLISAIDFLEDVTLWAPRKFGFVAPAPMEPPDVEEDAFWAHWGEIDAARHRRAELRKKQIHWLSRTFWALLWAGLLFTLAEIYVGPLLGPDRDFIRGRSQLIPTQNTSPTPASDSYLRRRLDNIEQLYHKLASKHHTPAIPVKHQVNWFAASNGAVVDPYLSSPIEVTCAEVKDNWYASMFSISHKCQPASRSHGQALRPWQEPDERWCAPPSRGKMQLMVHTPRPITPTELILEHLPKDAALRIGDAPKDIELWVDVADYDTYDQVQDIISRDHKHLRGATVLDTDRSLAKAQALPDTFVLVGKWTYNIYSADHVQSFRIPVPLERFRIKARRFALRVNSNWGNYDSSCLYRARLHGIDQSGIMEKLEADPDAR